MAKSASREGARRVERELRDCDPEDVVDLAGLTMKSYGLLVSVADVMGSMRWCDPEVFSEAIEAAEALGL